MYPGPIGSTSRFLVSCPDFLMISPAVHEAWTAWKWAKMGDIGQLYPNGAPYIILHAVQDIESGVNAGQAERMKEITGK